MSKEKKQQSKSIITEKCAILPANLSPGLSGTQRISLFYLRSVPFLTLLLGFGVGHVGYWWYLPAWLTNTIIMATAMYQLLRYRPSGNQLFTTAALLLITPWVIFPVFGGMGRPPQTIQGWLSLVGEQHVRFNLLILGGILAYLGSVLLYKWLTAVDKLFASLGLGLITLAIPLFIINMAYWGSFLSEAFYNFKTAYRPDWYLALRELFFLIGTVEVSLIYMATAMFALALGKTGYFKAAAVRTYVIVSLCAALINLIPPSAPEPFSTMSYLVCVPAIPFIMLYLMGVNLLRRVSAHP